MCSPTLSRLLSPLFFFRFKIGGPQSISSAPSLIINNGPLTSFSSIGEVGSYHSAHQTVTLNRTDIKHGSFSILTPIKVSCTDDFHIRHYPKYPSAVFSYGYYITHFINSLKLSDLIIRLIHSRYVVKMIHIDFLTIEMKVLNMIQFSKSIIPSITKQQVKSVQKCLFPMKREPLKPLCLINL